MLALASLGSSAVCVILGLTLLSAPVVFQAFGGSSVVHACEVLLTRLEPGGFAMAWAATIVLTATVLHTLASVWRCRRVRGALWIDSTLGQHEPCSSFDLIILPTDAPLAYNLGGSTAQVVVSEGLKVRLGEAGFRAVVAHEEAHVRGQHDRWLELVDVCSSVLWFVPWGRRAADSVRLALEFWADQSAAAVTDRHTLRTALLLAVDVAPTQSPAPGLNGADALAERVARLEDPAPRLGLSKVGALLIGASLATAVGGGAGAAAGVPELMALFSHICPL